MTARGRGRNSTGVGRYFGGLSNLIPASPCGGDSPLRGFTAVFFLGKWMDPINPTTTLQQAGEFGWPIFVLVLFLLLVASGVYLYHKSIQIPESEERKKMMDRLGSSSEKTADALGAFATTHAQYLAQLAELKESQSEMATELSDQGSVGRKLIRCTRVLCEMHERHDTENAKNYAQRMRDILSEDEGV